MRFTSSALTNAFIFSAVALLSLIPAAKCDLRKDMLDFLTPGGPGAPEVHLNTWYHVSWYVPGGETER
jgi:hypothetical protein